MLFRSAMVCGSVVGCGKKAEPQPKDEPVVEASTEASSVEDASSTASTEEEVEEWEKKIKDSLLRRDESISSVANIMKSAMSSVYEIGGSKLSLSNFGIETLGYFNAADNEKNAYH